MFAEVSADLSRFTLLLSGVLNMKSVIALASALTIVLSATSAMAAGGGDRSTQRWQARLAKVQMKEQQQESVAQKQRAEQGRQG
ncbi:hypothetical protein ACFW0H_20780 [Pseudomonas sp. CR3202]|uniref:hypothetical protein n=1 Tax=Pseudomonas sp. CR3202 TaxID=3351532 RepID=UPI003BF2CB24